MNVAFLMTKNLHAALFRVTSEKPQSTYPRVLLGQMLPSDFVYPTKHSSTAIVP